MVICTAATLLPCRGKLASADAEPAFVARDFRVSVAGAKSFPPRSDPDLSCCTTGFVE